MRVFESLVIRVISGLIVACLAVMLIMVFSNVVLRYGFNSGITASEEISRLLFVWMTYLGAIVAMKEHAHLGVDSIVRKLPLKARKAVLILVNLVMLFICYLLLVGSWQQTLINVTTYSPVTGVSLAVFYSTGIVTSIGVAAYLLLNIYHAVTGRIDEKDLVMVAETADAEGAEAEAEAAAIDAPARAAKRP